MEEDVEREVIVEDGERWRKIADMDEDRRRWRKMKKER
jgi:hypothetical protein